MKFKTKSKGLLIRSLLEGLSPDNTVHSTNQTRTKVPLGLICGEEMASNERDMIVSLTWTRGTGNVAIRCGAAGEDRAMIGMQELDKLYLSYVKSGETTPPRDGMELAMSTFRRPPYCDWSSRQEGPEHLAPAKHVPSDEEFTSAIQEIAETAESALENYPEWKTKMLQILVAKFGWPNYEAPEEFEMDHEDYDFGLDDGYKSQSSAPARPDPKRAGNAKHSGFHKKPPGYA